MILARIKDTVEYIRKYKILLILIIPAWALTLIPFIFDGQTGCAHNECGMLVGTNYRDGLWFLAVAATAFKTFPFQMPVFSGATLQGYHYIPNLLAYLFTYIGIPVTFTYYKLIPIFYISTMTILSIILARKIKDSILFVFLFLFFTFFGMHLSLFTSLYHTGKIQNTVLINTFQSTRILESPHAALALLLLYGTLIMIYTYKNFTKQHLIILGSILFVSFGTKFYVAVTILMILGLNELFIFIQKKNWRRLLVNSSIFLSSTALAVLLFYNPLNATKSGSIFVYSPFATVHHLIETPTLFYMRNMVLARYYLYEHGWSPRLLGIELFSTFLFVLFYFGTRIVGFFEIIKQVIMGQIDRISFIMTIVICILIAASVLFIQKGDWYNPIQFGVPAAFLMNIFISKLLYDLFYNNKLIGGFVIAIVLLITFPANLVNANYLRNPARLVIPEKEMEALNFLRDQPVGSIFVPIEENEEADTAYVSAFTGKPTYVNFTNVLENADIAYEERFTQVRDLTKLDPAVIDVDYFYIALNRKHHKELYKNIKTSPVLKEIFKNKKVVIFQKM